ncbi:MAG: hypothetical protein ACRD6W_12640, partial [Nitrososphaerales archaeon]
AGVVEKTIRVPRWNHWVAYERQDFDKTYRWMVESGLAPSGHTGDEVVSVNTGEIFGTAGSPPRVSHVKREARGRRPPSARSRRDK